MAKVTNIVYYPANAESKVVAGARLARWLVTRLPRGILVDGKTVRDVAAQCENSENAFNVFIVNVPKPMVAHVAAAEVLVSKARSLVWLQNDYAIQTPTPTTNGASIFTRAFTHRVREKLPMWVWTTCEDRVKHIPTMAKYVNWNCLAIEPMLDMVPPVSKKMLYWGAYRPGRQKSFARYFDEDSNNPEDYTDWYLEKYVRISATPNGASKFMSATKLVSDCFVGIIDVPEGIQKYAATVYMEDEMSHKRYHTPANRFYESLAAGVPMLIDNTAIGTIVKAGYAVPPAYISESLEDVIRLISRGPRALRAVATQQRAQWTMDPETGYYLIDALEERVSKLMKECKI